jgi:DNA-binding response OmpR family regulator
MATPPWTADIDDVCILHWPEQEDERMALAAQERPRLLLVPRAVAPPEVEDQLEDWLRAPADPAELLCRRWTLRRRLMRRRGLPVLDDDGLLRFNGRWVAIPDSQLAPLRLLLDRAGRIVRMAEIEDACERAGTSRKPASIRTMLGRLDRRCSQVGLRIAHVRSRGVVLKAAE